MIRGEGKTRFACRLVQELHEDALLFTHVIHLPSQPIGQRRGDHGDEELDGGRQHGRRPDSPAWRRLSRLTDVANSCENHRDGFCGQHGLITLRAGARSAGNLHATCDRAGPGNGTKDGLRHQLQGESRWQQLLPEPKVTAPALDPTGSCPLASQKKPFD